MKQNIEAVIFDMDGVIFDTEAVWKKAFFVSNEKYGIDVDEIYRQTKMAGRTEKDIRASMKVEFPDADIDAYRDHMKGLVAEIESKETSLLKPGFAKLVEMLKKKGIKIALATSSHYPRCEMLFENAGLDMDGIFDAKVTSEDVVNGKPNPEIFLKTIAKLGANAENCIVCEDSIMGILAAFSSGAKPAMVIDLIEPNDEVNGKLFKVFRSLDEVNDYIKSL